MQDSKQFVTDVNNLQNETGKVISVPDWMFTTPESTIMLAMDNLIATYGEDLVLDTIGSAYVAPGYEKE
jgi:hypothetical protein